MNILLSAQLAGWLMVLVGAFQLVPTVVAWLYSEPMAPLLGSAAIAFLLGLPIALGVRPHNLRLRPRDGFAIVTGAWLLASIFGALPYLTSGVLSPVDALFESVAGFTTTGSTVLSDPESLPRSILLWRAMTQWLGGMGIVVFTIALMPILGIGGMQLFKAEMPGPVTEKIRPRVAETARRLWFIYVGLTCLQGLALWVAGLSVFDALCHSLTTMSTGGFSTQSASIGAFASPLVEWIVIAFMLLAAMNFVIHYRLLTGGGLSVLRDRELRYFLSVLLLASSLICLVVWSSSAGASDGLPFRHILFAVVAMMTGTGYAVADFENWSNFGQFILMGLMVLGGMAGSTTGGVKSLRVVLVLGAVRNYFSTAGHRNAVRRPVLHRGKPVAEDVMVGVWAFLAVYFALAGTMALVISAYGYDFETAVSGGLTSVGNVGPGFGEIGPFDHFAHFPAPVKLCLSFCMIAGRLELFTVLVLLTGGFWRR